MRGRANAWGLRLIAAAALSCLVAACGGGTASGDGAAVAPSKVYNWKLVTTWPKDFPGLGTAPENLARRVKEMSNGRLNIKVYGAGELVPAFEVFDAVSQGSAEMGHGAAYYWRGKAPISAFFTTVPFGMNAQETNGWLHYGGGVELWRELYARFNLVPFACGNSGTQMAGWFSKEITSLADIQGLKMRIPGIAGEVFERAGGVSVVLPGAEIFTSLQTGAIDAAEWVGPYNDLALGLQDVGKYYYYPGWHEPGATLEAIVNKDAFESLPADLQAILEVATRAINNDTLDEFTARNNRALVSLVEEHGVELRPLPDDVIREFKRVTADVLKESIGDDPLAQKIYDSYHAFQAQVSAYHEISEHAYLNAREALR